MVDTGDDEAYLFVGWAIIDCDACRSPVSVRTYATIADMRESIAAGVFPPPVDEDILHLGAIAHVKQHVAARQAAQRPTSRPWGPIRGPA